LLDLKHKLCGLIPRYAALVDAFTVARQDEIDEVNHLAKSARTPEDVKALIERLKFPNTPELEFSTREHHAYLLDEYIEPEFGNVPSREMKVLMVEE
jgi:hypothetical protein